MPTTKIHTEDGHFAGDGRDQLDALLSRLEAQAQPKLLLHVHGGLVSAQDGEQIAERLEHDWFGALKKEGWETAYLIWESSVRETVENYRDDLAKEPLLVRYILKLAAWIEDRLTPGPYARSNDLEAAKQLLDRPGDLTRVKESVGADFEKAAICEALADDQLLDTKLAAQVTAAPLLRKLHAEVEAAASRGRTAHRLDREIVDRVRARQAAPSGLEPRGLGAAEVVLVPLFVLAGLRVIGRLASGRDHGVYCTIVEEIARVVFLAKCGAAGWRSMKQDTANHFDRDAPGDVLIDRLFTIARSKPVRVLLVGHSAGAVFGCYFAEATARPPPKLQLDYAFLAPAVRLDLAAELLVRKPRGLNHLRIFTMDDRREIDDELDGYAFGKVYPRSLLYLIAGVLEDHGASRGRSYPDAPILGLQRHLETNRGLTKAEKKNRKDIRTLVGQEIVYSGIDGGDGRRCEATTHGTIDRDEPTLRSVLHLARKGY